MLDIQKLYHDGRDRGVTKCSDCKPTTSHRGGVEKKIACSWSPWRTVSSCTSQLTWLNSWKGRFLPSYIFLKDRWISVWLTLPSYAALKAAGQSFPVTNLSLLTRRCLRSKGSAIRPVTATLCPWCKFPFPLPPCFTIINVSASSGLMRLITALFTEVMEVAWLTFPQTRMFARSVIVTLLGLQYSFSLWIIKQQMLGRGIQRSVRSS